MNASAWPFEWGESWSFCTEYRVQDFAAERRFFCELLGFTPHMESDGYAMLTSPDRRCFFAFKQVRREHAHPANSGLRLQLMIADIQETVEELARRGVAFERPLAPYVCDGKVYAELFTTTLRAPSGVAVDLWGMTTQANRSV